MSGHSEILRANAQLDTMVLEETEIEEEEVTAEDSEVTIRERADELVLINSRLRIDTGRKKEIVDDLKRELPVGVTLDGPHKITVTEKTSTRLIQIEADFKGAVHAYLTEMGMTEHVADDMTEGIWNSVRRESESVSLRISANPN